MSTTKQIQASRANGARSKGPTTPQGKLNSSRNSTRHGILAQTIVLEAERADRLIELLEGLFEEHQPSTPTEIMLVETIAAARWRQVRIWSMQKVAFDYDVATSTAPTNSNSLRTVLALRGSPDNIRTHELLLRYEIALDRQISRALLRLHQMQDRRKNSQTSALPAGPRESTAKSIQSEEPIASPSVLCGSNNESAPAKRTQQPIETVTQRLPVSAPIQASPAPQNQTFAFDPPAAIPLPKKPPGSTSAGKGKYRLARRK